MTMLADVGWSDHQICGVVLPPKPEPADDLLESCPDKTETLASQQLDGPLVT